MEPVEWDHDQPNPVQVTEPEYPEDSPADEVAELRRQGYSERWAIERVALAIVASRIAQERAEAVMAVIGLALAHERPGLKIWQIAFAAGVLVPDNATPVQIARRFGVSKQDMQQGIEKTREQLGMRKTRTMRCAEGRETMRLRNYRR